EMHHRHKKDAPSGSALSLAKVLADVKKKSLEDLARHGRSGIVGARTQNEIGIHALRGGDIIGDHDVLFSTMGETVSISHRATSRQTFARGALRAAQWAAVAKPGLFDMMDVLGLKQSH
ncbi:MAG: 4-hydroxy-tetrahydrodipicolinate reductase, partial [Verrucomicrobiae bacterium]|nr:4-hydroxy-tetrahydrodipicolinate reductase [Verrucomicrobiae bacterium]